jgi:hypothetical protein
MKHVLMRNHSGTARHSPGVSAAFTPADVENSVKRGAIAFYR